MKDKQNDTRSKVRVRWWHVLLLAILVFAFCGLAWWQWTRFQSGTGTFQNLGYALQWPLFAGFAVFAYRMILRYENEKIDEEATADSHDHVYVAGKDANDNAMTEIDPEFLPSRRNDDVDTFNELANPAERRRNAHLRHDPGPQQKEH